MSDYQKEQEERASRALMALGIGGQTSPGGPLLQLIEIALCDEMGGLTIPASRRDLTDSQWENWVALDALSPQLALQTVLKVMEENSFHAPLRETQIQKWAENVVLMTLDDLNCS